MAFYWRESIDLNYQTNRYDKKLYADCFQAIYKAQNVFCAQCILSGNRYQLLHADRTVYRSRNIGQFDLQGCTSAIFPEQRVEN